MSRSPKVSCQIIPWIRSPLASSESKEITCDGVLNPVPSTPTAKQALSTLFSQANPVVETWLQLDWVSPTQHAQTKMKLQIFMLSPQKDCRWSLKFNDMQ